MIAKIIALNNRPVIVDTVPLCFNQSLARFLELSLRGPEAPRIWEALVVKSFYCEIDMVQIPTLPLAAV